MAMPEDKNTQTPNEETLPTPNTQYDEQSSGQSTVESTELSQSDELTSPPASEVEPATVSESSNTTSFASASAPASSEAALPTEQVVPSNDQQPTPVAGMPIQQPPKKSKKKWIIAGIASFIAVLLIGGGALAYVLYQSPQKILGDAMAGLYQAKAVSGKVIYTSKESSSTNVDVTFDTASKDSEYSLNVTAKISANSDNFTLNGSGVYDKDGNAYFKLSGIKAISEKSSSSEMPAEVKALYDKYENKWIKVAAKDLKDAYPEGEKIQTCTEDLNKKLAQASFRKDIENTYRKHQFVVVKDELGVKDGNVGYQIDVDTTKADEFEDEFKKTASYKELESICDGVFSNDSSSRSRNTPSDDDTKVNVWISQWEHKLQTVEIVTDDSSAKTNATVNLDYDKLIDVKVPTDTISVKELIEDFQNLVEASYKSAAAANLEADDVSASTPSSRSASPLMNRFF